MKLIRNPLFYLSVVLVIILGFQVVYFVRAAFQEPSAAFPSGAPAAPLDTSDLEQTKAGILNIDVGTNTAALRLLSNGRFCMPDTFDGTMECKGAWDEIGQWNLSANGIFYNGSVAIATTDPGTTYELFVNGDAFAVSGWESSDARLKKNVERLTGALGKLLGLRGVSYEWRTDEFPEKGLSEGRQVGLIAQEVEKVFPELVNTDSGGYKALAYDRLTAILLEAIKEQQAQIDELTSRLQRLEGFSN